MILKKHLKFSFLVVSLLLVPHTQAQWFSNKDKPNSISLNFAEIDIRVAIELIAEHANKDIIISDNVGGNIAVSINDVTPEVALQEIVAAKNLELSKSANNVITIGKKNSAFDNEKEKPVAVSVGNKVQKASGCEFKKKIYEEDDMIEIEGKEKICTKLIGDVFDPQEKFEWVTN